MESLRLQGSEYARSLIEASRDPLFTISPDGKITDINNASVNITEVTREKLIGTDFFEYFTEPDKARDIYKQVFTDGFVADFPLTIRDGKLTDVLFNGAVYKDEAGKVIGVVVVARDVTDHKRIENELMEAKVLAEQATKTAEIAQLKAEDATKIAESAVKSKQQFLSNMSHEIRTPMNSIIGFTKVMLKTPLTAKQKEFLTAIKLSGDVLTVLVNDILDLAKVDAGKMIFERKPFSMASSISAMIQLFEPKILEKNLKLITKYDDRIPHVLEGDPIRLHQILINLVSNAVKFTNEGKISVEVLMLDSDEEKVTVEFTVTDTGIGIDEDKIDHIFENFQQATSNTSSLYGGTGLGLAIAKQLAEQQNGTIRVMSEIDKGTRFTVVLPFRKTTADIETEIEIKELKANVKGIKVLVVEDIPINQLLMKTVLDDFGFVCDFAGNGKIAIEKFSNKPYDIVLMDLQMPEMNGFQATKYIRETMSSRVPIIALTADVTTADLNKCKTIGMNDYISKPVDEKQLYYKIIELVRKSGTANGSQLSVDKQRYTDLTYLNGRTKSNPILMREMIRLYLEQTPPLISAMKESLMIKDWDSLFSAVHKIIPSFYIMGIHKDYEAIGKKVQEYARSERHVDELEQLVNQLEKICTSACIELNEEYELIMK